MIHTKETRDCHDAHHQPCERLRQLSENDAEAVQSLPGQCGGCFRLHEGGSVPPNAAAERVSGIPSAAAGRAKPF